MKQTASPRLRRIHFGALGRLQVASFRLSTRYSLGIITLFKKLNAKAFVNKIVRDIYVNFTCVDISKTYRTSLKFMSLQMTPMHSSEIPFDREIAEETETFLMMFALETWHEWTTMLYRYPKCVVINIYRMKA